MLKLKLALVKDCVQVYNRHLSGHEQIKHFFCPGGPRQCCLFFFITVISSTPPEKGCPNFYQAFIWTGTKNIFSVLEAPNNVVYFLHHCIIIYSPLGNVVPIFTRHLSGQVQKNIFSVLEAPDNVAWFFITVFSFPPSGKCPNFYRNPELAYYTQPLAPIFILNTEVLYLLFSHFFSRYTLLFRPV